MCRNLAVLSLPLLAVLAGCGETSPTVTVPEAAPLAERSAAAVALPFSTSSYSFQIIGAAPEPGCNAPGEARLALTGEGTATYLGRFTVAYSFCSRADLTLTDGRGTFTAANGDRLDFTFEGTSSVASPSSLDFTSFVTFTGGTERFREASGQAVVTGIVDLVSGAGSGRWNGTISSVGANVH